MPCANHPNVTTFVRCSRCGKPICPRCMHATPVGYRCADCYNPGVAAQYKVESGRVPLAALGGLGVAAVGGALVAFLPDYVFFIALLMGFLVSDTVARLSNEKRGPTLQYVAIGCIVAGLVVTLLIFSLRAGISITAAASQLVDFGLATLQDGRQIITASGSYITGLDGFHLIMYALAAFMVWIRLR